jgi:predicted solute-binding protein
MARRAEIAAREQDPSFALHYLNESIRYELGEEEKQGLALFHEFLIKLKIVSNKKSKISYF